MKSALFIQYFDYKLTSELRCCTVYKSVISKLCNEKLRGGGALNRLFANGEGDIEQLKD